MDDLKFVSVAARENPWVGLRSRLRRFQLLSILRRDIIPKSEMDRWYVIRDVHDQWLQEKGIPPTEDQAMEIIKRDYIGKFKDKNSGREPEQDLIEKELGRYRDLKTRGMFSSSLDQQVDAFDPNSDSLGSKLAQRREVGPAHLPTVREEVLKYLEEDRAFIKQWLAGVLELPDDSFASIPRHLLAAAMFMLEGGGSMGEAERLLQLPLYSKTILRTRVLSKLTVLKTTETRNSLREMLSHSTQEVLQSLDSDTLNVMFERQQQLIEPELELMKLRASPFETTSLDAELMHAFESAHDRTVVDSQNKLVVISARLLALGLTRAAVKHLLQIPTFRWIEILNGVEQNYPQLKSHAESILSTRGNWSMNQRWDSLSSGEREFLKKVWVQQLDLLKNRKSFNEFDNPQAQKVLTEARQKVVAEIFERQRWKMFHSLKVESLTNTAIALRAYVIAKLRILGASPSMIATFSGWDIDEVQKLEFSLATSDPDLFKAINDASKQNETERVNHDPFAEAHELDRRILHGGLTTAFVSQLDLSSARAAVKIGSISPQSVVRLRNSQLEAFEIIETLLASAPIDSAKPIPTKRSLLAMKLAYLGFAASEIVDSLEYESIDDLKAALGVLRPVLEIPPWRHRIITEGSFLF